MAELSAKELAEYALADIVGHFLLNPADKSTRATLAHLLQDNLGGELSAWLKVIDDTADPKRAVVVVEGGLVQDVEVPSGVVVEVRDYDNAESLRPNDLNPEGTVKDTNSDKYGWEYGVDKNGDVFQVSTYEAE